MADAMARERKVNQEFRRDVRMTIRRLSNDVGLLGKELKTVTAIAGDLVNDWRLRQRDGLGKGETARDLDPPAKTVQRVPSPQRVSEVKQQLSSLNAAVDDLACQLSNLEETLEPIRVAAPPTGATNNAGTTPAGAELRGSSNVTTQVYQLETFIRQLADRIGRLNRTLEV